VSWGDKDRYRRRVFLKEGAGVAAEFHVLALRYWKWGNVPEKTRNEFHAKDATIAKRASTSLSFSRIPFQELA
jgi:hypothetical protein